MWKYQKCHGHLSCTQYANSMKGSCRSYPHCDAQNVKKCPVKAFDHPVRLRMVWVSFCLPYSQYKAQFFDKVVLKVSPLIFMDGARNSLSTNELIMENASVHLVKYPLPKYNDFSFQWLVSGIKISMTMP